MTRPKIGKGHKVGSIAYCRIDQSLRQSVEDRIRGVGIARFGQASGFGESDDDVKLASTLPLR